MEQKVRVRKIFEKQRGQILTTSTGRTVKDPAALTAKALDRALRKIGRSLKF